jgi:hypothetical protein
MTKTFKELQEVDALVGELYVKDKTLQASRFGYAYKRFSDKNYSPLIKELQDEMFMIRINNALENPQTKEVLVDATSKRGFKFSKAGLTQCIKDENVLMEKFNEKEIEIKPYVSTLVPELAEEETELLKGLVI